MKLKKSSILFLLFLFIILIFVIGVRYGQRVEKTNKLINYLISLPPSPSIQPTQPPLKFKTYEDKTCGIKFLYPSQMNPMIQSSGSAQLSDRKENTISFICAEDKENKNGLNSLIENLKDPSVASAEFKFQSKTLSAKKIAAEIDSQYLFSLKNPKNNKTIFFGITETLYPLFEKSLEFSP